MIDLNQAEEQRESTGGKCAPPDSIVMVQMTIRLPKAGAEGSAPMLTRAQSGLEQLDCEFSVIAGTYQGAKWFDRLSVGNAHTEGQKKAVDIAMRTIRAMVEASRNISPKDVSQQATQGRVLQSWEELNGVYFPAKLDAVVSDPNNQGKRYINNKIKRVVTPDMAEEYYHVWNGGEIISDKPLPEIPAETAPAKPSWAAPAPAPQAAPMAAPASAPFPHAAPAPAAPPQAAAPRPAPNWAQTPPPAAAPRTGNAPY
jgi:hypothetical protein